MEALGCFCCLCRDPLLPFPCPTCLGTTRAARCAAWTLTTGTSCCASDATRSSTCTVLAPSAAAARRARLALPRLPGAGLRRR